VKGCISILAKAKCTINSNIGECQFDYARDILDLLSQVFSSFWGSWKVWQLAYSHITCSCRDISYKELIDDIWYWSLEALRQCDFERLVTVTVSRPKREWSSTTIHKAIISYASPTTLACHVSLAPHLIVIDLCWCLYHILYRLFCSRFVFCKEETSPFSLFSIDLIGKFSWLFSSFALLKKLSSPFWQITSTDAALVYLVQQVSQLGQSKIHVSTTTQAPKRDCSHHRSMPSVMTPDHFQQQKQKLWSIGGSNPWPWRSKYRKILAPRSNQLS
jgi:hypothetical protein